MSRNYKIYAIDFDGTLVENKWPEIGKANQDMINFVKHIQQRGDKWILWTMRSKRPLAQAMDWCHQNRLRPDAVNDNLPELIDEFGNNPRKVYADYYIDDHNKPFEEIIKESKDYGESNHCLYDYMAFCQDQIKIEDKILKSCKSQIKLFNRILNNCAWNDDCFVADFKHIVNRFKMHSIRRRHYCLAHTIVARRLSTKNKYGQQLSSSWLMSIVSLNIFKDFQTISDNTEFLAKLKEFIKANLSTKLGDT